MSNPPLSIVRLLLVDPQAIFRAGLRLLLESHRGLRVVGETGKRLEAIAIAGREQPDIILMDLMLGADSALEMLPQLLGVAQGARVIVLTDVRDTQLHQQALQLGALGIVHKEQATEQLIKAIEKVHSGEAWVERSMLTTLFTQMAHARGGPAVATPPSLTTKLTGREREVIKLIGAGLKNRQIAERLAVSEITVRHYLTSIFDKVGVSDRLELMLYAYRHGLVSPPQ